VVANLTGQSSKTAVDIVRSLTEQSAPRTHSVATLRGLVAITFALRESELTPYEFGRGCVDVTEAREDSNLIYKWVRGKTIPSRTKIAQIDRVVSGTLALYDHPFFDLLADRPLTVKQVRSCLRRYANSDASGPKWRFADDERRLNDGTYIAPLYRSDTSALRKRGDLDGVTVILGLVREAEALGRTHDHMACVSDLYRSLPSLATLPWFRKHRRLIAWCIQRVHFRDLLSFSLLRIHWPRLRALARASIQGQMLNPVFRETFWRLCEREDIDVVDRVAVDPPAMIRNPVRAGDEE
jgi:hypothetical protein